MCGLVGFIDPNNTLKSDPKEMLKSMLHPIKNRGPDNYDFFLDKNKHVGLGHARLSIQDLSLHGNQPMISHNKRYVIAFNGEIYNHLVLRKSIGSKHLNWRGSSDTETLIEYISIFGIEKTLKDIKGMFAFALWDLEYQVLYLARDPFGEKPLCFLENNNKILFSSELKSFFNLDEFKQEIDPISLKLFLEFNYVPSPKTILNGISKVQPGTFISFKFLEGKINTKTRLYFDAESMFLKPRVVHGGSEEGIIDNLDSLLNEAVSSQMISDVPIGSLLSGGVDSSLISALMQNHSNCPIDTFTIGFENSSYDESVFAREISKVIGSNHHELILKPRDIINKIPNISSIWDEPFADSSQVPSFFVMELAKKNVTVALSGDGGDELFGGYNRYLLVKRLWNYIKFFPLPLRSSFARLISMFPAKYLNYLSINFGALKNVTQLGDKLHKTSNRILKAKSAEDLYLSFIQEASSDNLLREDVISDCYVKNPDLWPEFDNFESLMMFLDIKTYLADDILTKVDRASMIHSLETRAPFLDKDVAEFAISLPIEMKIRKGQGKYALRKVLNKYVPERYYNRPKMGFSIPLDEWLRGPLNSWCKEKVMLNPSNLLNNSRLEVILNEYADGVQHGSRLWNILIFNTWYEENILN